MHHPKHPPMPEVAKMTDLGRGGGAAADVARGLGLVVKCIVVLWIILYSTISDIDSMEYVRKCGLWRLCCVGLVIQTNTYRSIFDQFDLFLSLTDREKMILGRHA